jgi:hypothetical protein
MKQKNARRLLTGRFFLVHLQQLQEHDDRQRDPSHIKDEDNLHLGIP